ncbi:hypothetical protein RvY_00112, partial [Ramazzottius varieornatus]
LLYLAYAKTRTWTGLLDPRIWISPEFELGIWTAYPSIAEKQQENQISFFSFKDNLQRKTPHDLCDYIDIITNHESRSTADHTLDNAMAEWRPPGVVNHWLDDIRPWTAVGFRGFLRCTYISIPLARYPPLQFSYQGKQMCEGLLPLFGDLRTSSPDTEYKSKRNPDTVLQRLSCHCEMKVRLELEWAAASPITGAADCNFE